MNEKQVQQRALHFQSVPAISSTVANSPPRMDGGVFQAKTIQRNGNVAGPYSPSSSYAEMYSQGRRHYHNVDNWNRGNATSQYVVNPRHSRSSIHFTTAPQKTSSSPSSPSSSSSSSSSSSADVATSTRLQSAEKNSKNGYSSSPFTSTEELDPMPWFGSSQEDGLAESLAPPHKASAHTRTRLFHEHISHSNPDPPGSSLLSPVHPRPKNTPGGASSSPDDYRIAGIDISPRRKQDYVFIFVPGLYSGRFPGAQDAPDVFRTWFETVNRDLGLECRYMEELAVDGACEDNAAIIYRAVENIYVNEGKRTVLLGYSKGSADISAAISIYKDVIYPMIAGYVSLLGAFGGSTIASGMLGSTEGGIVSRMIRRIVEKKMECRMDALRDLTLEARDNFIMTYPFPTDVTAHFPILSVAGTLRGHTSNSMYPLYQFNKRFHGAQSDGVICLPDQVGFLSPLCLRGGYE